MCFCSSRFLASSWYSCSHFLGPDPLSAILRFTISADTAFTVGWKLGVSALAFFALPTCKSRSLAEPSRSAILSDFLLSCGLKGATISSGSVFSAASPPFLRFLGISGLLMLFMSARLVELIFG